MGCRSYPPPSATMPAPSGPPHSSSTSSTRPRCWIERAVHLGGQICWENPSYAVRNPPISAWVGEWHTPCLRSRALNLGRCSVDAPPPKQKDVGMDTQSMARIDASRERLRRFAEETSDEDLARPIEGDWTA